MQSYFIVCDKCNYVPFVTIKLTSPVTVEVKCKCKEYHNETFALDNFINRTKEVNNNIIQSRPKFCENILSHRNNPVLGFCKKCKVYTCKKYFCLDRLNSHHLHKTIELQHYSYLKVDSMLNNLSVLQKNFNETIIRKQEQYKNNIEMTELIDECKKRNEGIINFIRVIIDNYKKLSEDELDVHLIMNVVNNTQFNYNCFFFGNKPLPFQEDKSIVSNFYIIKENRKIYNNYNLIQKELLFIEEKVTITAMIQMKEDIIILSLNNNKIILFEISTQKKYKELCHSERINDLCKIDDLSFLSCSDDKTIKKWSILNHSFVLSLTIQDTFKVKQILYLHSGNIISLNSNWIYLNKNF